MKHKQLLQRQDSGNHPDYSAFFSYLQTEESILQHAELSNMATSIPLLSQQNHTVILRGREAFAVPDQ